MSFMEGKLHRGVFVITNNLFKKIKGLENLDLSKGMSSIKMVNMVNPLQDINERLNSTNSAIMEAVDSLNRREENERQELLEAIKGIKSIINSVSIEGDATGLMIGTQDSFQTVSVTQEYNYEEASKVLELIKGYFDHPLFDSELGGKAEEVKQIVNETLELVKSRENPTIIKKLFNTLNGLTIGATGSLIASGIQKLIESLL